MLVVGNQTTTSVAGARLCRANLAVFRIRADGKLDFAQRYDLAVAGEAALVDGSCPASGEISCPARRMRAASADDR